METITLNIEVTKEIAEKLHILQQQTKKKHGITLTESSLIQNLITKEFIRQVTPFDLKNYQIVPK
jgi:hypothetical protein